jgi:hypothetical protein
MRGSDARQTPVFIIIIMINAENLFLLRGDKKHKPNAPTGLAAGGTKETDVPEYYFHRTSVRGQLSFS